MAAPLVLQYDLASSPNTFTSVVENRTDAYSTGANDLLLLTVEMQMHGGRYSAQGTISEVLTQRSRDVVRANGANLISALNEIAQHIDNRAAAFPSRKDAALREYAIALSQPSPSARVPDLESAIQIDPNFGLGYLALAELESRLNSPDTARTLAAANSHWGMFTPIDRARLEAFKETFVRGPLSDQAHAAAALLALTPNDLETIALLASEQFLSGDATGGERLMRRALQLRPDDPRLHEELGVGLLEAGQYQAAEKSLASVQDANVLLPQIATCMLLGGNSGGADSTFARYLHANANEPAMPLIRANWMAISQSPAKAAEYLKQSSLASPDVRSLALSQSAIFHLMSGDPQAALASASAALPLAVSPVVKGYALASSLTAQAGVPAEEFRAKVDSTPLDANSKRIVLAYGFFLQRRYAEAADLWQSMLNESGNTDLRSRAMLASCLNHLGRGPEAAAVKVQPFVPNLTGLDEYAAVAFQEMRRIFKLQVQ